MADPIGDQDQSPGGAGKRPAPTIEGTATELAVEPPVDDASSGDPKSAPEDEDAEGRAYIAGRTAGPATEESGHPPAKASLPELKGFVTHLAAGFLGGLVGVVALAIAWGGLPGGKGGGAAPDLSQLEQRVAKLEAATPAQADTEAGAQLDPRLQSSE